MIVYYVLLAISPFSNPPIVSRFLGDSDPFKIVGGFCLIYALYEIISRGYAPPYFRSWQARLFAALVILGAVSFFSRGLGHFFQGSPLLVYSDFVIFFFVTLTLVNSTKRLRWVLFAMAAGIIYGSADVIRDWHSTGFNLYYRAGDGVTDMNYFTTNAALILPFIFLMALRVKKRWERLFYWGGLLLSTSAVVLSGSRGGFVAVSVALLYVIAHLRHRARNLLLLSLLTVPLLVWLPMSPVHRFLHPVSKSGVNTEETRIVAWKAGLRMFETHPFFGVGLGNFEPLMPLYADPGVDFRTLAHNTYIQLLAEMGPAGLLLFLAVIVCAFRSLRKVRHRTRGPGPLSGLYVASLALEAGLLGFLAGAFFLSAEYERPLWVVIFLTICLPRLVRRTERVEVQTEVADASPVSVGAGEGP